MYVQLAVQQQMLGKRQHSQLNTSGEASRISDVPCLTNLPPVQFRQAVNKRIVIGFQTVVRAQVYHFQLFRQRMGFHKIPRVPMRGAEEKEVNVIQKKFAGKGQIRFPVQPTVHIGHLVSRIAAAVDKNNFGIGVAD